ncbi:mechanosensitive ion channel family protein [Psychroflexus lacisalsi]|jgi:small conductance mechanosensitive channel|uniref:Small-conductance mechanosensitive channel MscS n=1 Tax=Psychroflexus lacisalsi TaxID=503928 RepID=A0ABP3VMZ5_9FLAO|nr:mechanosensitive ion channel family protein [Psychroflexus lacisalsi]MBZ9620011.1 mechanosensitive ion channel family protein [Psychroflexus lacisalsi]
MQDSEIIEKTEKSWSELSDKVINWVDSLILNLPNFLLAVLVLFLFVIFAKYSSKLVDKIFRKSSAQDSIRTVSVKVFKVFIIGLGLFLSLGILNLNTVLTSILGAAGVIGLAVGFALQGTLHNTFAGVIISFIPKLQIGDWIETNDYAGFVVDINLRSVVIQTVDYNLVIIPNSKIVDAPFKNFSRTPRGRIILTCGVGYESDLPKVQEITVNAIKKIFEQRPGESIQFYYTEFGDSSINYQLRFWADVGNQGDVYKAQHNAILAIKAAYNENDINIPFPIRTLDFGKNKFRSEKIDIRNIKE